MKRKSACSAYGSVDSVEKSDLIKDYLPLVKKVVQRIRPELPKQVELAELVNAGVTGLVAALECYDPQEETNFATYAQLRIKDAVLDSVHASLQLPGPPPGLKRRYEEAYDRLSRQFGGAPDDAQMAWALRLEEGEFERLKREMSGQPPVVLTEPDEREFQHSDALCRILETESDELISRGLDRLTDKENLVLRLCFFEEKTSKEVAEIMHVSASRVSQVKAAALEQMKKYLEDHNSI